MKLSFSTKGWHGYSFETFCRASAELGFAGIELHNIHSPLFSERGGAFYGSEAKTKIRSLNYADTEVMARVAAASSIIDDDTRRAEYQALEEIIVLEDAAWLPLYENTHLFAIGDRVADFTPHWAGYTNFYAIDMIMK